MVSCLENRRDFPNRLFLRADRYIFSRIFPYPLMTQLNLWQKLVHTVGAAGLMVGYTNGLKKSQRIFIGTTREKKDRGAEW